MYFDREVKFDANPDLFQLSNCVLDLKSNAFRRAVANDFCLRSSTIAIPENWLTNPSVINSESQAFRTRAWDIVWSMFKRCSCEDGQCDEQCACPYHPDDNFESLGDQDEANFEYLHKLMAKLLEGRPAGFCIFLYSKRGRNSKGLLEKIFMAVWGGYHVPVKPTVFMPDTRNENEHSSADVFRRGARIGFSNEVGSLPSSNGVFKNKNSSDPLIVRSCGANDTDVAKPTLTHVFATNDRPQMLAPTKGSEEDRATIVYLPNRFRSKGERPTSPRTFQKNLALEEEVGGHDFALGVLLNLIQVRQTYKNDLASIVAEGTPTSKFWRAAWVKEWASKGSNHNPTSNEDISGRLLEIHKKMYNDKRFKINAGWFQHKDYLGGSKANKWTAFRDLVKAAGALGSALFRFEETLSRKGTWTEAVIVTRVDIVRYLDVFSDVSVFGKIQDYTFFEDTCPGGIGVHESADEFICETQMPSREKKPFAAVTQVVNLVALEERARAGVDVTGERRQEQLV